MQASTSAKPNRLIQSTSPYLLQHAYNPVDWFPWGEEALQKALQEDKPIILSIGYSACHWCHVMERECFEHEDIAALMNKHFICIKVDREERPDIDAIYMDAVSVMGQQGGWPLNAFITPQGKPFYAGTYFPPAQWVKLLQNVANVYAQRRAEVEESADGFLQSIARSEIEKFNMSEDAGQIQSQDLTTMFEKLAAHFDTENGGLNKAPKFPMPSIYFFLLHYYHITKDDRALNHTIHTLTKMALGGIYDQIGGGFARYSVDELWFAPHFEKMLYDNGQLISLYVEAYKITKNPLFKSVVYQTMAFLKQELTSSEGGFYAALDADSEGVEGKFYIWTADELKPLLKDDYELFCKVYNIKEEGNWEHNSNILHLQLPIPELAALHQISANELAAKQANWAKILKKARNKRIKPHLDDKILTSWNALMLKGLTDAFVTFNDYDFLHLAMDNAYFLKNKMKVDGRLYRSYKKGQVSIPAYLEDYALLIEAFTAFYQATFDLVWLQEAETLLMYVLDNFWDETEGMFFFTDTNSEQLIARKKEIFDNVIPSSNSVMAKNLYYLGTLLDKPELIDIANSMLAKTRRLLLTNVEYLANWGSLACLMQQPTAEIVLIGENYKYFRRAIEQKYYPNKVFAGSLKPTDMLPLLKGRTSSKGKTTLYLCFNKACQLPVDTPEQIWEQLKI